MLNIKFLQNPFYLYIFSFTVVILIYLLGWSELFPDLSPSVIIFFIITFLISFFLGKIFQIKGFISYQKLSGNFNKKIVIYLLILWAGHVLEFLVAGKVPLLDLVLHGVGNDYSEYGIKVFHVILIPYNSFLIVYVFHIYLSKKRKKYFFYYLLCLLPALLIINRGMFLIGITSSFFIYIMSIRPVLKVKLVMYLITFLLIIFYAFGYIGNIRSGGGDPYYILNESKVSDKFINSNIPPEYYWVYLYGASPLANFQNTVNNLEKRPYLFQDFLIFEMLPDVISKRIAALFGKDRMDFLQLTPWLTVGTVYSRGFLYLNWFGVMLLYVYTIFIITIVIAFISNKSKYHVTVVSILLSLVFYNTFSNMIYFSGIILQLFFPLVLSFFDRYKFSFK
jgi:hypothetical protein